MIGPIQLPWPDKALSPNGRAHWAQKARAVKAARREAWITTLAAMDGRTVSWQAVDLHWIFRPKTATAPDEDNIEAASKAYRDGIADALGIDDANFRATREIGLPIKGGAVFAIIRERTTEEKPA